MKNDNDSNDVKSTLVSRNITVMGKRTSVRLEPEMWSAMREIAKRESCTIHELCSLISMRKKEKTSLTAAIRVFLMLYYRASSTEEGHERAGHGDFENMKRRARMQQDFLRKPIQYAVNRGINIAERVSDLSVRPLKNGDERGGQSNIYQ